MPPRNKNKFQEVSQRNHVFIVVSAGASYSPPHQMEVLMEAFHWALIGLSGSANLELALAGLELARNDLENEAPAATQQPETIPLNYPGPASKIEDDGSPALKISYESIPGSPWRSL
jgi:hypothetical protein